MGLPSETERRCGCRCECVTTSNLHGDVVRRRSRSNSHSQSNNDDGPDAVLEGLAMAGLVAILRQLGDLAELAAEVFDELQEQVVTASTRGRRLAVRAKRLLEADLDDQMPPPSTQNSAAAAAAALVTTTSGAGAGGGMIRPPMPPPPPRLVDHRIKRCCGPPRLSLLDKFDPSGEGACLKRYTDPSFFRAHYSQSHPASKLEQGSWLRGRANARGPYLLKPISMETSKSRLQTRLNSEPPKPAHTVTDTADCKSETETETETDASEEPSSPGFLSMLRQLNRQAEAAGAASLFRIRMQQQTATVHRVQSSSLQQLGLGMEKKKLQLQGGTAQPSTSPSPGELERTSSFEAWLSSSPLDAHARRFPIPTTAATTHHHEHDEIITHEPEPQPPHPHTHTHTHTHTHGASATTTACISGSVSDVDVVTTSVAALSSSSTMLKKAKLLQNYSADAEIKSWSKMSWRYKGSVEMIASRVSSLPRKLFMNIVKNHHDCQSSDRAGTSSLQDTTVITGDCSLEQELEAVPTPRAPQPSFLPILLHSDPVIHNLVPQNDKCHSVDVDAERHDHQQQDPSPTDQCSNSSTPETETCGDPDPTCTRTPPDSNNLLLPGILVRKPPGANFAPDNSSSGDTKVDTPPPPPPPPIPPMQWLSEKVHTRPRAASPKHRAISQKVGRADKSNDVLHSVSTQVAETIPIQATSIHTSPVDTEEETLVSDENTSANVSHRDEMKCSEETIHPPQQFRVREDVVQASSEGSVPKSGELPVPAILSDEAWSEIDLRTQAQAVDTCFQQQGRLQFGSSNIGHCDEKRSEKHEASHSSSNLKNESVFLSAVQELAKMSPPPSPSVPSPKHPLALRNGPSLIHPSRNILDSRRVLIEQIKDIAMAGNPSFKLKPVSGASSPVTGTGSPTSTNYKVASILQRAYDIRQADTNNNDVDSEVSWSDDSE